MHMWPILLFSALLAIVIALPLVRKRISSGDAYLMDARQTTAFGAFASTVTLIGAGELVTVASLAFAGSGMSIALLAGYGLGLLVLAILVPRLRANSKERLYTSLPDLCYDRYGPAAGILASLLTFVALFALLAIQLATGSALLSSLFHVPRWAVSLLGALTIGTYLSFGAYGSVTRTDKLQLLFLVVGVPLLLYRIGASPATVAALRGLSFPLLPTVATLATGILVVLGSGDIFQRLYATRSDRDARLGLSFAGGAFIVYGFLLASVGLTTRLLAPSASADGAFLAAAEIAVGGGGFLGYVVLAAICSALLSTADTEVFVLSSLATKEWYRWHRGYKSVEATTMAFAPTVGRVALFAVAILGWLASLFFDSLVLTYTALLYFLLGLSPVVLFGALFRISSRLATLGLAVGLLAAGGLLLTHVIALDWAVVVALPGIILLSGALIASKRPIEALK